VSTLTGGDIAIAGSDRQAGPFACAACGHEQSMRRPVARAEADGCPFDLFRCRRCGLVQQHPRYTLAQLAALYGEDYYVFDEPEPRRWARAVQQYVVHLLPLETRRGLRLLDVGSALGHMSALAAARGWRVTGVDVSAEAVSQAATRFGLDFRAGRLALFRDTLPPFDVAFLGDVIEHVPRPADFLADVGRCLSSGGIVCIDTPNWGSTWRLVGRRRWLGLNKYHINLFDENSLSSLLANCGFDDCRFASYTHYRYAAAVDRPEVQALLDWLPRFLAWRLNRRLARRVSRQPWNILRTAPPDSLDRASQLVEQLAALTPPENGPTSADNLVAAARKRT